MKALLLTALAALAAPVPAAAGPEDGAGAVVVTLGMEARSRGTEVRLGDVAQVTGEDPALVERVRAVELGYAPAPGYSRVFRDDQVRSAVAEDLPAVEVRLLGQRAVRVRPEVETILGEEVLAAARTELARTLAGQEVEVSPAEPVQPVEIPAGSAAHELRARIEQVPEASRTVGVPVEVLVDGVRYRTVWTTWEVRVWEHRPVLARPVRAGERLESSMFERRRVLREAGETPGLTADLLRGAVALRDFAAGESVSAIEVQRPTVVVLGETVFLRVRKGAIEARVPAVALQSGAVGDRIKVRATGSAAELVATIDSRDLCSVDLGG